MMLQLNAHTTKLSFYFVTVISCDLHLLNLTQVYLFQYNISNCNVKFCLFITVSVTECAARYELMADRRHQDKFPVCTFKCHWLINIFVSLYPLACDRHAPIQFYPNLAGRTDKGERRRQCDTDAGCVFPAMTPEGRRVTLNQCMSRKARLL